MTQRKIKKGSFRYRCCGINEALLFNNTKLDSTAGIIFEKMEPTYFSDEDWKIVTFIETSAFEERINVIENVQFKLRNLCSLSNQSKTCGMTYDILKQKINSLLAKDRSYKNMVGHRIQKRAWFNVVGTAFKTIFGTLDQNDAEYYTKSIDNLNQRETDTINLLQDQVRVVKSTITNFNETLTSFKDYEKRVNENFDIINNITHRYNSELEDLETEMRTEQIISFLTIIVSDTEHYYDMLINSILFARSNILHPYVLSPSQYITELTMTISHLPVSVTYALPLKVENTMNLLQITKLTVFSSGTKIIFIISNPLILQKPFTLYKISALPVTSIETNGTFYFIQPTTKYVAISYDQSSYHNFQNLQECHLLPEKRICMISQPFRSTANNPTCETNILLNPNSQLSNLCDKRVIRLTSEIWYKTVNDNSWLYVYPKTKTITIACKNEKPLELTVNETGILSLTTNCKAYTGTNILSSTRTDYMSEILNVIPPINILPEKFGTVTNDVNTVLDIKEIKSKELGLDELDTASHKLDDILESAEKIKTSKIFKVTSTSYIAWLSLFILLLYVAFKIYNYCKQKFIVKEQTPQTSIVMMELAPQITPHANPQEYETTSVIRRSERVKSKLNTQRN